MFEWSFITPYLILLVTQIGTFLWQQGKSKQQMDTLKEQQDQYVRKDVYDQCQADINRRLSVIEGWKVEAKLATIETQLAQILNELKKAR